MLAVDVAEGAIDRALLVQEDGCSLAVDAGAHREAAFFKVASTQGGENLIGSGEQGVEQRVVTSTGGVAAAVPAVIKREAIGRLVGRAGIEQPPYGLDALRLVDDVVELDFVGWEKVEERILEGVDANLLGIGVLETEVGELGNNVIVDVIIAHILAEVADELEQHEDGTVLLLTSGTTD
jgi:hypothetical protein